MFKIFMLVVDRSLLSCHESAVFCGWFIHSPADRRVPIGSVGVLRLERARMSVFAFICGPFSFFTADARGCGYVKDSFMGSRAVGVLQIHLLSIVLIQN